MPDEMSDELDLLRAANPVPADAGPWRDRPLDARALRGLNQLRYGRDARKARRRLVVRAEAAVLALVAVVAFAFSDAGAPRAAAAPVPLRPHAGAAPLPLDALAERAEAAARAAGEDAGPRRGSHLQAWNLSMETGPDAAPPVTVPEERITRWRADGSGSELVVATDPQHPGRPVIDDSDGRWRTVNDGKVLHRRTYPADPGHRGALRRSAPPSDPAALRTQLSSLYGGADRSTPHLLLALSALLQQWTPGPRETTAIVRLLAGTEGLRPVGEVTDRLGRHGQAYVFDGPDGGMNATRQMVVLDPRTGRVLGMEVTFTKDLPDFKISSGDVLSYEAWL